MDTSLVIANVLNVASALIILSVGFLVLIKGPRKLKNILFFFLAFGSASYNIYFLLGTNIADPDLSWQVWMFNSLIIVISISYAHLFLFYVLRGKEKYKNIVYAIYIVGAVLLTLIVLFPHSFIPDVTPKLYFKNYINPGPLYYPLVLYFVAIALYVFVEMVRMYRRTVDVIERRRIEYFIAAALYGYSTGIFGFFLVFDITIDPAISLLNGTWVVPIFYGIMKQQILDIRVVIKRALVYSVIIAFASGFLVALSLLNQYVIERFPGIQFWVIPTLTAVGAVFIGRLFWKKSQEADLLKYEFITIAAHKLRTPLTRVKWELENMRMKDSSPSVEQSVNRLSSANNQLILLTDALIEASHAEESEYSYNFAPVDLEELTRILLKNFEAEMREKNLSHSLSAESDLPKARADLDRIRSVLRVLVENAIMYSSPGGSIEIHLSAKHGGADVLFSITDVGIGVSGQDRPRIFTKFFRTALAKQSDTEGIGLGLYMSEIIIQRHGGEIGFSSLGEGKGSTFWFSLPKAS